MAQRQHKIEYVLNKKDDLYVWGIHIPKGAEYDFWQTTNFGWIAIRIDGKVKLIKI